MTIGLDVRSVWVPEKNLKFCEMSKTNMTLCSSKKIGQGFGAILFFIYPQAG